VPSHPSQLTSDCPGRGCEVRWAREVNESRRHDDAVFIRLVGAYTLRALLIVARKACL
jgi:hypothetical protein